MSNTYVLELTEDHAEIVRRACEVYARLLMGQFQELTFEVTRHGRKHKITCADKDMANDMLYQARRMLYPDLQGWGHSYGVRDIDFAAKSFEVHQAIQYVRAWHNHPEGGVSLSFDKPMPLSGEKLPKCRIERTQP